MSKQMGVKEKSALRESFYKQAEVAFQEVGEVTMLNQTEGMLVRMAGVDVIVKVVVKNERVDTEAIFQEMAQKAEAAKVAKEARERKAAKDKEKRAKAKADKEKSAKEGA